MPTLALLSGIKSQHKPTTEMKPKRTVDQVLTAVANYFKLDPECIRHYRRTRDGKAKNLHRATIMTQGLAKALGNSLDDIMSEIPRKNKSSINAAHSKLIWNVENLNDWRWDCEKILKAL
jgi:hypothetical protein